MHFPAWAPPNLRLVWEERDHPVDIPWELEDVLDRFPMYQIGSFIKQDRREQNLELLERIITDERMKTVWGRLAERSSNDQPYDLMLFVILQRIAADWVEAPKDSAKEKVRQLRKVIKQAAALSQTLKSLKHLPEIEVGDLLRDSEVVAIFRALDDKDDDDEANDADAYGDLAASAEWLRAEALRRIPPLEIILIRLCQLAAFEIDVPVIVKQPGAQNARAHFFVRQLSWHFQRLYQKPLHEIVAVCVSVALNIDLDEDAVRGLVRGSIDTSAVDYARLQNQYFGDWSGELEVPKGE